jgi:SHS2 domain-containing protein
LVQTHKEIYNEVKFKKFLNNNLEAELIGNKVESFGEDIKAVTYHGLKIEKSESGFQATILLDI